MKEILGDSLQTFFDNTDLKGINTYKRNTYEVWEISDEDYKIMCEMTDEDFEKNCHNGWWRYSEGSNLNKEDLTEYIINSNKILAFDGEERKSYHNDFCKYCDDLNEYKTCDGNEKDVLVCLRKRKYNNLSEYLREEIQISQQKNICAVLVDLAKYNNMKLSELLIKYKGEIKYERNY